MSGWFIYEDSKYNHIEFKFSDFSIYFNDFRNFGTLIICNKIQLEKKLNQLGPDILSEKNNFNEFLNRLGKKRNYTLIANALLDQKVAAGVGNYIRSEALYITKLSPFKEIQEIKEDKLKELWNILKQVGWYYYDEKKGKKLNIINNKYKIINLYKKSGPSKYKPGEGYFLVYRQKNDPYGNKVITAKLNNRTVHFVKEVQK